MAIGPLVGLFEASLARRAAEPALDVGPPGGPVETLSFGRVAARSTRMAHVLARRGLRPGDRLVVQLANRLELLDLFLACLKLGAVFVPVNVLYREREVGHVVGDAEPAAVVTTGDLARLVPRGTPAWDVDVLAVEADVSVTPRDFRLPGPEGSAETADPSQPVPSELPGMTSVTPAAIVYTSGTTGRAKGAVLTHGNLAANARTLVDAWRITAEDRYLAVLPLFHVHGLGNGVCSWLASGCRMRLVERFEHDTAEALFELLPAHAVLRRTDDLRAPPRAARRDGTTDRGEGAALRLRLRPAARLRSSSRSA